MESGQLQWVNVLQTPPRIELVSAVVILLYKCMINSWKELDFFLVGGGEHARSLDKYFLIHLSHT